MFLTPPPHPFLRPLRLLRLDWAHGSQWTSCYCPKQVSAQVHEKEQEPGLPGPACVWGAAPCACAAHRPAAAAEHPASHALLAQPVPGPGEPYWGTCRETALGKKSKAKELGGGTAGDFLAHEKTFWTFLSRSSPLPSSLPTSFWPRHCRRHLWKPALA